MNIDCHVHVSAFLPEHGYTSPALMASWPFRMFRWRLGIPEGSNPETLERAVRDAVLGAVNGASELDAAVVLALDAVHDDEGNLDRSRTALHVTNDYAIALTRDHDRLLFGCSVHPYRRDAARELERCIDAGAALLKWLPVTQGFNPADRRCFPLYEMLAHHGVPLLSHTGGERTTPVIDPAVASPALLVPALERGVTVIAAHCGARSRRGEHSYVDEFARLARDHERMYGDTAALTLPLRWYALDAVMAHDEVRAKLIHGSDWPIPTLPPPHRLGAARSIALMRERNGLARDVATKRALGLDEAYLRRGASLVKLPRRVPAAA